VKTINIILRNINFAKYARAFYQEKMSYKLMLAGEDGEDRLRLPKL
jgi:hypothetical protein